MDVCNLLIIDDDPNIRNLLNELLAGRQDILLLSAGSGPEAVKFFASNRVDVVLTDIHMPGFTGLELMADMKKINFKPEILVMTANATPESVETSRKLGARSVILKPFDDLELIEAEINKAVAAARAARAGGKPAAVAPPAAAKPVAARPAAVPAAAPAPAVPDSGPLPDFDAWNGDLTGNDTPVAAAPPVAARPAPGPIAVAPSPAASLRPANGQGLRAAPKPAPPVAAVPRAAAPAPEPPPDPPAPVAVQRPPTPAPVQRPPAQAQAPRPVAAPPASAPVPPVAAPAPAPRVATAAHAPAPHPPAAAPAPAPRPPVAVPAPAPRHAAAAPGAHAASAAQAAALASAPALAPPPEEAVPEIPAALEGIFRTASRFDTGKLRMQVPIVCLQTWEERGAIAALRNLAASLQREFYVWSAGKGLVKENGQLMGDIYREPGRALEFIHRHKSNGLYLFADFRTWLEDKAVVRLLREMAMELETARSMLVLTAPRLPVPPELQPVCATFDWPAGGSADPLALYEEVAEEVAAATGLGLDLAEAERDALLKIIKDMPPGRARFEIARALMARAR
ncbi:MAG TPA: response regulator [Candidatus Binatia bacterium]|nr:response regulator [Candidatus Binatia bacterium]